MIAVDRGQAFIEPEGDIDTRKQQPASYLRRAFTVSGEVASASLAVKARGLYRAYINGQPVDDQVFMPGFTYYHKRLQYQTYAGYHWGEWLEPGHSMFHDIVKNLIKSDSEVATAYYAYSSRLLSEVAFILGREEDAKRYAELHENIKRAYRYDYTRDGVVRSRRQCRFVRPVELDLLPEEEKRQNVRTLNDMVKHNSYRIGTGYLTPPFVLSVLSDHGYADTAYGMLENTESTAGFTGWSRAPPPYGRTGTASTSGACPRTPSTTTVSEPWWDGCSAAPPASPP